MSQDELKATRDAIANISKGHDVNEDSWMTMWCNTNWGDLLQPAPLSVSLLGSIIIIAASTTDFSLVSEGDVKPFKWEYASAPGSFKTCLMQMVGDGLTAYESAHESMQTIRDQSSGLPQTITEAVQVILKGTPQEVAALLPGLINSALDSAQTCMDAADKCEGAFKNICGLAQELMLACTNKVGTTEQKLAANEQLVAILKIQSAQEEDMVKKAQETDDMMRESFKKADDDFHNSVANVPKGWDIVGMQVVESLTQFVVSAGNAAVGMATMKAQAMQAGLNAVGKFGGTDSPAPPATGGTQPAPAPAQPVPYNNSTLPNSDALTDPGLTEAVTVQTSLDSLNQLIRGGPNGAPDWDHIRPAQGEAAAQTGAIWLQHSLESSQTRLTGSKGKSITDQLMPLITSALDIIKTIEKIAASADSSNDNALDTYAKQVDGLVQQATTVVSRCNLILQQAGNKAAGPATPPTPPTTSTSAAQLAVESARRLVDETRANLEVARDSYDKAADRLLSSQAELTKTIGEMTSLNLQNAGLKAMLPVLKQAVGAFTTLRAQFSQLLQFFISVASLLKNVLGPSVSKWAKTMESSQKIAGITMGDITRQLIYTQMMVPLKVSVLSEKIASAYLDVSTSFILPAQEKVGGLMTFAVSDDEAARQAHLAALTKAQNELKTSSDAASKKITAMIQKDQEQFRQAIETRLTTVVNAIAPVYPAVKGDLPKQIEEVKNEHLENFDKQNADEKEANPMYDPNDLL